MEPSIPTEVQKTASRFQDKTSLSDLLKAGLIKPNTELELHFHKKKYYGVLQSDGIIRDTDGNPFLTPSAWVSFVNGIWIPKSGWRAIKINGTKTTILSLKNEYKKSLKQTQSSSSNTNDVILIIDDQVDSSALSILASASTQEKPLNADIVPLILDYHPVRPQSPPSPVPVPPPSPPPPPPSPSNLVDVSDIRPIRRRRLSTAERLILIESAMVRIKEAKKAFDLMWEEKEKRENINKEEPEVEKKRKAYEDEEKINKEEPEVEKKRKADEDEEKRRNTDNEQEKKRKTNKEEEVEQEIPLNNKNTTTTTTEVQPVDAREHGYCFIKYRIASNQSITLSEYSVAQTSITALDPNMTHKR